MELENALRYSSNTEEQFRFGCYGISRAHVPLEISMLMAMAVDRSFGTLNHELMNFKCIRNVELWNCATANSSFEM